MRRQVLGVLALAAGWGVLVADSPDPNHRLGERFDVQYEFQTSCMGKTVSGLLDLYNDSSDCSWSEKDQECSSYVSTTESIKEQGLNIQGAKTFYKQRDDDQFIPIGFDFELIGEPVEATSNEETTAPIFDCKGSRTHETLAVDKDYFCENRENPSETCELKLVYLPPPMRKRCKRFDVQYEFQTNCMGREPSNGLLNIEHNSYCDCPSLSSRCRFDVGESTLQQIREQGLNVQSVTAFYEYFYEYYAGRFDTNKFRGAQFVPIEFSFKIIGEPVGAPNDPDTTAPIFICTDPRTYETLAVDRDYHCEAQNNPHETCELKLIYQPKEVE